jgi:excisionase family DNA binding protein
MQKKDTTRGVPPLDSGNPCIEPDRTISETAAEIRCSPSTVYRLINAGEITAYKRGDRTIIEGPSILEMRLRNRIKAGDFPEVSNVA